MLQEHKIALRYVIKFHRRAAADAAEVGRPPLESAVDGVEIPANVDQLLFIKSAATANIGSKERHDLGVVEQVADGVGLLDKLAGAL